MSRIDRALNVWEQGGKGAASAPDTQTIEPGDPSPLAHYPHEESNRLAAEPAIANPPFEAVERDQTVEAPADTTREERRSRYGTAISARLVTGEVGSVSLEQYRRLAAVLHEEQMHSKLKSVMVTSALPGEGKTLTITNLALTLSGSYGRRVLLIDADLRAPALHRLLKIRNNRGLGEALREAGRDLPIVAVSDRLDVLTAGRPGPSPLADLTSDRMAEVIREGAERYDWLLLDTPPVGLLPDAQVLARLVGAVVFVIAAGSTPSAAVERAVSEIGTESIIGTVLNRVDDRAIPEANYYDEYYGDQSDS